MSDTFERVAAICPAHAGRAAIADGRESVDYAALPGLALALAAGAAGDMPRGSRVVLLARNSVRYAAVQLGLEAAGHVRVPLNWRSTAVEVENVAADCGAAVIVHDARTREVAAAAVDRLVGRHVGAPILRNLEDLPAEPRSTATTASTGGPLHAGDGPDVVSINYTSGTLGAPKGVVLDSANWAAVSRNLLAVRDFRTTDRLGLVGPLSHAAGAYLVPAWLRGATIVLADSAAPSDLAECVERQALTVLQCVPTVLTRLVADGDFVRCDRTTLRLVIYGAERMPRPTLDGCLDLFGPILAQNYGLTEAMMTCCTLLPEEHYRPTPVGSRPRYDSIGRPYPGVEIVVRREDGSAACVGEVGEITIRSPHVMRGYWQRPEATARVLRAGWLWSGDLAAADEDGFLELKGRARDLVISGGVNIWPSEVEGWLQRYPELREVAVFGMSDAAWGERLVAAVVPHAGPPDALDAVRARARGDLGIRCPRQWLPLAQLPRNGNGKLDLRALQALAAAP